MNNNLLPDYEIDEGLKTLSDKLELSDEITNYITEVLSQYNNVGLPGDLGLKYTMIEQQVKARDLSEKELKSNIKTLFDVLILNKMLSSRDIINIILALTNRVINENKRLDKLKEDKNKKKKK